MKGRGSTIVLRGKAARAFFDAASADHDAKAVGAVFRLLAWLSRIRRGVVVVVGGFVLGALTGCPPPSGGTPAPVSEEGPAIAWEEVNRGPWRSLGAGPRVLRVRMGAGWLVSVGDNASPGAVWIPDAASVTSAERGR